MQDLINIIIIKSIYKMNLIGTDTVTWYLIKSGIDSRAELKKTNWLRARDSKLFTCEVALWRNVLQKIDVITLKFSKLCTDFAVFKLFYFEIVKFNNKTIIAFKFRSIRVFVDLIKMISTSDYVFGQYHFYQVDKTRIDLTKRR